MHDISPLTVEKLADQIYNVLKESILKRVFTPGQRLDLTELEEQLGVSRTPIKEALNHLEVEGLVHIEPRRGTFVARFSLNDVQEYFEIRQLIETYAARRLLERATNQELARLERLVQEMEALYDPETGSFCDNERVLDKDRELHMLLVKLSGNQKLLELYENLKVHTQVAFANYGIKNWREKETIQEHRLIYEAIRDRNPSQLVQALTEHLQASEEHVLANMQEQTDNHHRPD